MSLTALAAIVVILLTLAYALYGRLIARQFALDDKASTPAAQINDGVDFAPTKRLFLLGQHFSAIAAAGPIAGPILACQLFGWGPSILWIALGVVFIGAVHDFSALIASVRHHARSIAEIVKENLGRRAWLAILAFIWIALICLIIAFADITAATFVGQTEELQGRFAFNPGGAVAAASLTYLLLSIAMGLVQRRLQPPLWLATVVFVPATLGAVWLGTQISTLLVFSQTTWAVTIMIYCFIGSLLPVWLLLQPRGYLGGFVLYLALAIGIRFRGRPGRLEIGSRVDAHAVARGQGATRQRRRVCFTYRAYRRHNPDHDDNSDRPAPWADWTWTRVEEAQVALGSNQAG